MGSFIALFCVHYSLLASVISDLVAKRHDAEEKEIMYRKYLREAEELHHDLETNFHQFERQKENMLEQAKEKANQIVEETKKKTLSAVFAKAAF